MKPNPTKPKSETNPTPTDAARRRASARWRNIHDRAIVTILHLAIDPRLAFALRLLRRILRILRVLRLLPSCE